MSTVHEMVGRCSGNDVEGVPCAAGVAPADAKLLTMSTLTEEGVMAVKHVACDRLLASRVEAKLQVS